MPNNYDRGRRLEDLACRDLRKAGYIAQRTAGSHGPWDVTAVNADGVRLIQVKALGATRDQDRIALLDVAAPASVSREIWERGRARWILEVLDAR
jgi:Holliday junction resolvase-like predicted endonuclease